MKAPSLLLIALIAITFAGVAQAGTLSPLYLTQTSLDGYDAIIVVQGNSIVQTIPYAYGDYELPIAVWGDVRTTGYYQTYPTGGQYTLGGTPTGTSYLQHPSNANFYDSTSDGTHNFLVDYGGWVYQTARDFTNPVALFNSVGGVPGAPMGITYDAANNSLWISGWGNSTVADYSLTGTLLSSFSTGHGYNSALALDPADHTLWLMDDNGSTADFGYLEQYSQTGTLLSVGPLIGYAYGAEFNLAPTTTPEPGTLILFGSGVLGLAGFARRKINL